MRINEISVANSAKLQKQIVSLYDVELAEIKAPDTREVLANILYNRDLTEVNAIKIAFYLSKLNDEHAHAEGYRNATEMIMHVTGLKKSMISNYIKVAKAYFWDENREFFVPDCLQGFTITQLTEGLEKVGSVTFMEDIMQGEITPDMSAKAIRTYYKERENAVDTTATEATAAATEATANATETTETTANATEATANAKEVLYLVDENRNRVAILTPLKPHTIDSVVALGKWFVDLEKVEG